MKGRYRYECDDCEREFLSDLSPEAAGFHWMDVVKRDPPRGPEAWWMRGRRPKKAGVWLKMPEPEGGLGRMLHRVSGMGLRIQCPDCGGRNIGYRGESEG